MDMSALNYRTYNVSTDHENIMNTAQSSSPESDHYYVEDNNAEILFDDGTSNDDQYETAENTMPGYEVIAVDPNCFYSSDEDVDVEFDVEDDDNLTEILQEETQIVLSRPIQIPSTNTAEQPGKNSADSAFDIIDESLLIEHDEILFAEDTTDQFDLASYIAGEASSLILSPLAPTKLNQQNLIRRISPVKPQQENNSPFKGGRRKRRNLTKAFIDTDDDSDSDNDKVNVPNKIQKDNDPIWDPYPNDVNKKKNIKVKDSIQVEKPPPTMPSTSQPTNNLRSMLKKQILSDRPISSSKLTKMMSTKSETKISSPTKASIVSAQTKETKIGVGRGKNINFAAKHFDVSELSDNSERDSTDSEDNNSLEEEDEPDKSSELVKSKVPTVVKESNTKSNEEKIETTIQQSKNSAEIKRKITETKVKSKASNTKSKPVTTAGSVLIDNDSLDNNDFAKAIFVDVKNSGKNSVKKNMSDKRKVVMLAVNAGDRFKTNSLNRPIAGRPFADLKLITNDAKSSSINILSNIYDSNKALSLPKIPLKKSKPEVKPLEDNSVDSNDSKPNDIDVVTADKTKPEQITKKKLNIHEYLKRKGVSATNSGGKQKCQDNILAPKTDPKSENENIKKTNSNSMYEEIIIVSIGCGTDISIPELSFGNKSISNDVNATKSTVLLSDIQTTIVKANSAIEQGKISSTSLISSIQNEILKKSTENQNETIEIKQQGNETSEANVEEVPEHGENKVIMHLRKDRVKPRTATIAIQTEPYFQFPPLARLSASRKASPAGMDAPSEDHNRSTRNYRQKNISEASYYSDEECSSPQRRSRHSEFMNSLNHQTYSRERIRRNSNRSKSSYRRNHYSRQRTISRSLSQSSDTSTSSSDSTSSSNSSSSASSASSVKSLNSYGDSSTKSYYNDDQYDRQRYSSQYNSRSRSRPSSVRSNSPEERRIVYVGRLEPEKTKDDLRKMFSVYGHVTNVSIHYKEMKWKYGFVTFARPGDAYTAIDDSPNNPTIKNYDISFGGRRAFCRDKYLDLDNIPQSQFKNAKKSDPEEDSFEVLLRKMKRKLQETKE